MVLISISSYKALWLLCKALNLKMILGLEMNLVEAAEEDFRLEPVLEAAALVATVAAESGIALGAAADTLAHTVAETVLEIVGFRAEGHIGSSLLRMTGLEALNPQTIRNFGIVRDYFGRKIDIPQVFCNLLDRIAGALFVLQD